MSRLTFATAEVCQAISTAPVVGLGSLAPIIVIVGAGGADTVREYVLLVRPAELVTETFSIAGYVGNVGVVKVTRVSLEGAVRIELPSIVMSVFPLPRPVPVTYAVFPATTYPADCPFEEISVIVGAGAVAEAAVHTSVYALLVEIVGSTGVGVGVTIGVEVITGIGE